jgi:asparagine synthase (glutamine-hydrolysing)
MFIWGMPGKMCGLAGFIDRRGGHAEPLRSMGTRMVSQIRHRGPDDTGVWASAEDGVVLAHQRLAIIDLSAAGHQPMKSRCGRYVLVYNGEIYNHLELREGLSGPWRGHSDTETLLACIERWGLVETLRKIVGMFALALWDCEAGCLQLARDRVGEKPMYYGWQGDVFLFGSELKAIRIHPAFRNEIDRDALSVFLRHSYVPAPHSIYRGISKLTPGHVLTVTGGREADERDETYWSFAEIARRGREASYAGSDSEAVDELDALLRRSIRGQMLSDVPLGAFLSGGVDSSSVVALMQAQSTRPVKTFSIGFNEEAYNEARYAKAVAQHLGTEHTELYVTPSDTLAVIPLLPALYDEPFSDSSQIPTYLVSELTRRHVTVSLSGDAGDELFGGYNRYLLATAIWRKTSRIPPLLRRWAAGAMAALSPEAWDLVGRALPERLLSPHVGDRIHKVSDILLSRSPDAVYHGLVSHWKQPAEIVIGATEPATALGEIEAWMSTLSFEERMMLLDALTYLPDDILAKVDRAAMGVSLETRVPFLDHRVVEFAWHLPLSMKIRDGQSKWILRQVLYRYVPKELIERPKMGFGVPIEAWLRGPLRDWAEDLLDASRLRADGFFDPAPIRRLWEEHVSGRRRWHYHLWDVLMFQAWWKEQTDATFSAAA